MTNSTFQHGEAPAPRAQEVDISPRLTAIRSVSPISPARRHREAFTPSDPVTVCAILAALWACEEATVRQAESMSRLVAEERVRVGSVDDPRTAFTAFYSLDVAPNGWIYTAHPQEHRIRIFDEDGNPLGAFGAEGEGPGEFLWPDQLFISDGGVHVWDTRRLMASHFDPDGNFLGGDRFRPRATTDPRFAPVRPNWLVADDTFVDEVPVQSSPEAVTVSATPILRVAFDGTVLDTLALKDLTNQHQLVDLAPEPIYEHQFFGDVPLWAISPTALELVIVDRLLPRDEPFFRVTKLSIGGDTLWTREYSFEPVLLESPTVDEYVRKRAGDFVRAGFGTQRQAEGAIRAGLFVPDHIPAASEVFVGRDGSVWIELRDINPQAATWLRVSNSGEVVGLVDLPGRFIPRYAEGNRLLGLDFDALDIPYLVAYEIRG